MIERHDVQVEGGALACYRLGHSDEVAVAAHGITSNSRTWLAVARALGDRAALLALDLRGRAASSNLPGPYGVASHVRDLLSVLDALQLERAVLVGHSLGAYIISRLAALHPERVAALVLVDGGLPIPGAEKVDIDAFSTAPLRAAILLRRKGTVKRDRCCSIQAAAREYLLQRPLGCLRIVP